MGFEADITTAVLAEVLDRLGPGGDYSGPTYLHIKTVGRTGGRPIIRPGEKNVPAFFMEYLAGGEGRAEIGQKISSGPWPSVSRTVYNVYAVAYFTPAIVGLADQVDVQLFYQAVDEASSLLMHRLIKCLAEFTPQVTDAILGYAPNRQGVNTWSYILEATTGDRDVTATILLRYWVEAED